MTFFLSALTFWHYILLLCLCTDTQKVFFIVKLLSLNYSPGVSLFLEATELVIESIAEMPRRTSLISWVNINYGSTSYGPPPPPISFCTCPYQRPLTNALLGANVFLKYPSLAWVDSVPSTPVDAAVHLSGSAVLFVRSRCVPICCVSALLRQSAPDR